MAKDFFQDIVPPSGEPESERSYEIPINVEEESVPPRGIRSIQAPVRSRPGRLAPGAQSRVASDMRSHAPETADRPRRQFSRWWIWVAAALSLLVIGVLSLLAFRSTVVTVTPKSRLVTFTDLSTFVAQPAPSGASPTPLPLSYTLQISDIEDSEVVPSQGTKHVGNRA